jgi:hypothetical protein
MCGRILGRRSQPQEEGVKSISLALLAAVAMAALAILVSAPMHSSGAYASKMDGKDYGCSDRGCRGINSPTVGKKPNVGKKK